MNKEQKIEKYLKSVKQLHEKITIHEKQFEEIKTLKELNDKKNELKEIRKQLTELQKSQSQIITNHFGAN